jgi:putative transposase
MTYRFVDVEQANHAIATMCRVLRVSRSGYYAWRRREPCPRRQSDRALAARIAHIHAESDGTYGTPRIHAELADHGVQVSRRRVARLMREQGLEGVSRRRRRSITKPGGERPAAPDLVGRRFQSATGPNQVWWADITYVPTWQGFLYVALVVDAWSRRIVGWSMRDRAEAALVVDALGMATLRRLHPHATIHHSDRGGQYRSTLFGQTLQDGGLVASMGRRGSALDNAACESVMATFKTELVHRRSFKTRDQARESIFRWIEGWYNPRRRHSSLGYRSPDAFEALHESIHHDLQQNDDHTSDLSPSKPPAKALPLPKTGPYGPADRDRPALQWARRPRSDTTPTKAERCPPK